MSLWPLAFSGIFKPIDNKGKTNKHDKTRCNKKKQKSLVTRLNKATNSKISFKNSQKCHKHSFPFLRVQ